MPSLRSRKQLIVLRRRIVAASGLSYIRTAAVVDLTTQTTHTFAGVNIGTASAGRVVLVGCYGYGSGSPQAAASMTIGGVSASLVAGSNVIQNATGSGVFALAVAAGTTATIALTWAGSMLSGGIIVYALNGVNATPAQSDVDKNFASSLSSTITVPSNGVAISFAGTNNSVTDGVFTNTVEDGSGITVDPNVTGVVRFQSAHNITAGAQTPTITPPSSDGIILQTIAFGP